MSRLPAEWLQWRRKGVEIRWAKDVDGHTIEKRQRALWYRGEMFELTYQQERVHIRSEGLVAFSHISSQDSSSKTTFAAVGIPAQLGYQTDEEVEEAEQNGKLQWFSHKQWSVYYEKQQLNGEWHPAPVALVRYAASAFINDVIRAQLTAWGLIQEEEIHPPKGGATCEPSVVE